MATDSFFKRWSRCKLQKNHESKKQENHRDETLYAISSDVILKDVIAGDTAIDSEEIARLVADRIATGSDKTNNIEINRLETESVDSEDNELSLTDNEKPALTMDDVNRLKQGDSAVVFLGKGVSSEIKKAALCKLFQSDVYNVLDGLNDYDLDYSNKVKLSVDVIATVRQWTKEKIEDIKPFTENASTKWETSDIEAMDTEESDLDNLSCTVELNELTEIKINNLDRS